MYEDRPTQNEPVEYASRSHVQSDGGKNISPERSCTVVDPTFRRAFAFFRLSPPGIASYLPFYVGGTGAAGGMSLPAACISFSMSYIFFLSIYQGLRW